MIEPIYIEAEQTRVAHLDPRGHGATQPDDRRIEWAPSLKEVQALLVGEPQAASPAGVPASASGSQLTQARAIFEEMRKAYAAGDFAHYGELLRELDRVPAPPQ